MVSKLKTISAQRPRPSRPEKGEKIDTFSLNYIRARNKNAAHSLMLDLVCASGMTRAELARMLGKNPAQITRWLGNTGNITLNTLSDLIFAASGSVVNFTHSDPWVAQKSNQQAIQGYLDVKIQRPAVPGGEAQIKIPSPKSEQREPYVRFRKESDPSTRLQSVVYG